MLLQEFIIQLFQQRFVNDQEDINISSVPKSTKGATSLIQQQETISLSEDRIISQCLNFKHNLIRKNNKCYGENEDFKKIVVGTLYGSKFFEKNNQTKQWTIDLEKATKWLKNNQSKQQIQKTKSQQKQLKDENRRVMTQQLRMTDQYNEQLIYQQQILPSLLAPQEQQMQYMMDPQQYLVHELQAQSLLQQQSQQFIIPDKKTKQKVRVIEDESNFKQCSPDETIIKSQILQQGNPKLLGKRNIKETVDQFEQLYQMFNKNRNHQQVQQQNQSEYLTELNKSDNKEIIKDTNREKLIGMLHSFMLLKPVIQKSLKFKEKEVINLLQK
eukprot:403369536